MTSNPTASGPLRRQRVHLGGKAPPTLMMIRDRAVIYARPGAPPEQELEDLIAQARAVDVDEVRRRSA